MVRRPAPVLSPQTRRRRRRPGPGSIALGVPLVALGYFLAAPALPALPAGDTTVLVAGTIGLLLIAATTLSLLGARDTLAGPLLIALGAGLLVGALNAPAAIGAGANAFEAMLAAALGLLVVLVLRMPLIALALPLFVAGIECWSIAAGPAEQPDGDPRTGDALSLDLPAWGGEGSAGQVGLSDAVLLSMLAAWALRHGFRRTATIAGLVLGLIASLLLGLLLDRAIPPAPLIAAGYLLPNLDRLGQLLSHDGAAPKPG